jgi:hypothetical protein
MAKRARWQPGQNAPVRSFIPSKGRQTLQLRKIPVGRKCIRSQGMRPFRFKNSFHFTLFRLREMK